MTAQTSTRLVTERPLLGLVGRLPAPAVVRPRRHAPESLADLLGTCADLVADGTAVTVVVRRGPAADEVAAEAAATACVEVIEACHQAGIARQVEVALPLTALGLGLAGIGPKVSADHADRIAHAARVAGATLLLEADDHRWVEETLEILRDLRKDVPEVGVGLAADLRRTEEDCRALAYEGSRVRLSKGARRAPVTVAFADRHEADKSYVRCLKVLLAGHGTPVVATHDPRLVRIAGALGTRFDRPRGSYEYQLRAGVRGEERRRLLEAGDAVRVRIAFGADAADSLLHLLADRGRDLTSFLRSWVPQR